MDANSADVIFCRTDLQCAGDPLFNQTTKILLKRSRSVSSYRRAGSVTNRSLAAVSHQRIERANYLRRASTVLDNNRCCVRHFSIPLSAVRIGNYPSPKNPDQASRVRYRCYAIRQERTRRHPTPLETMRLVTTRPASTNRMGLRWERPASIRLLPEASDRQSNSGSR